MQLSKNKANLVGNMNDFTISDRHSHNDSARSDCYQQE